MAGQGDLAGMQFGGEFRRYQRLILEHVSDRLDDPGDDERFHLVSPPGSGKTVLGLEMIRRLGERAVVFAPTTTIQRQWIARAGMFSTGDSPLASSERDMSSPITALTYQSLSTVGSTDDGLRDAARRAWEQELIDPDTDVEAVSTRLDAMRANNAPAYSRELRRRVTALRRRALREPDSSLEAVLHPRAVELIDAIVSSGVRTVVLDECHHLLDYWALVLAALIARIDRPRVIGLTATLPSPEDGDEYDNYVSLLGDVTYEVPTPAVVREGDLAPYRDLAAFTAPTKDEAAYLESASARWSEVADGIASAPRFGRWLREGGPGRGESPDARWRELLRRDTPLAIAALRHASSAGLPDDRSWLPPDLPVPHSASDVPTMDDTFAVLERYALDELKISPDPADHASLQGIKDALATFGMTLTESGIRQGRAIVESVLSYSAAKTDMAARILATEESALGSRFRAAVVTDFEVTGSLLPGAEARGSARTVFTELTRHPSSHALDPVLVTGKTLWADVDAADRLISWFNAWLEGEGLDARCSAAAHPEPTVVEVQGHGPRWTTGTYVRMVTAALEAGQIRVLVGTRGLLAEGWDALTLNVLIDLTTAATATGTQQLRGRTLRKDPSWPEKVAHNWDVVCTLDDIRLPAAARADLRRLERRHRRLWGIIPDYGATPEDVGRVVTGLRHVDGTIAAQLDAADGTAAFAPGASAQRRRLLDKATDRALAQPRRRQWSHDAWRIGEAFDNSVSHGALVSAPTMRMRTSHTVTDTLKAVVREFRFSLVATGAWVAMESLNAGARTSTASSLLLALGLGAAILTGVAVVRASKVVRRLSRGDHVNLVIRDIGRAVALGLRDAGLIAPTTSTDDVRVVETEALAFEVALVRASEEDAALFAASIAEVLAPIDRQRYLLSRDVSALPQLWLRPLWALLRRAVGGDAGVTYHPVPEALGARKDRALAFARHWNREVGRGELIFTKNPEGYARLEQIRTVEQPRAARSVFERWT